VYPSAGQTITVGADDTQAFVQTIGFSVLAGESCTTPFTVVGDLEIGDGIIETAQLDLATGEITSTLSYPGVTLAALGTSVFIMVDNLGKEIS
jgi:hypothetical protein